MARCLLQFVILAILTSLTVADVADASIFGIGAEDNEENIHRVPIHQHEISSTLNLLETNVGKSTREDPEDVECMLNAGPMIAPNVLQGLFVDARVSLLNPADADTPQPSDDMEDVANDDMDNISSNSILDDMLEFETIFNSSLNYSDDIGSLIHSDSCNMKMSGETGTFDMNFDKDCLIQIKAANEKSRVILNCSPTSLQKCAVQNDSLSINLVGDTKFGKNSYLYCGDDVRISAISLKNKLAIRVKSTKGFPQLSRCVFHSRQNRQYESESSCGRLGRSSKIVGGRRVPPGLFPWVAQLDITRTDGSKTACTGSIIAPSYILTAAHCMKRAESISAFMGGTDRHEILGTEILIQAEKYILHRKWSSRTLVADIALVKLTEPIEYNEDISPICLPAGKLLTDDLSGRRGVAVGWGRIESRKKAPRRLYRVKLPLLSEPNCKQAYRRFFIPKVMMCTDSKTDAAICYGMTRNSANFLA